MPGPIDVPWPLSSFPGAAPQESGGRLINVSAEPLGDVGPAKQAWHRQPGLSLFATTAQTGYRGGLIVNNLSYDIWSGQAATVSGSGVVTLLGSLPGTKKVTIARNQLVVSPNIMVVDIDNGCYELTTGVPVFFNGGGNLPQPNSVCFQDSYFFWSIADGRIFASGNNSNTVNANTFTKCQAKSDVTLYRVIAYSGLLLAFTSASCEVFQDTAQPAPGFPYTRQVVLEYGLAQPTAIAGWEIGFSNLCWVAQDYGVYNLPPGSLQPVKISPPDLDRLIEAQVTAGTLLDTFVYVFAGKKFFVISSPTWSWEFNLNTLRWNERSSLISTGSQGRWRATSSHLAFGKWLVGDAQSGNLGFIDDTNFTEFGAPQLARMESGPIAAFPNRLRIPRADFNFVTGVGQATRSITMTVTGASAAANGNIILAVNDTSQVNTNDTVIVSNVGGTTEANGTWAVTVLGSMQIQLQGSVFVHAYTSGGTAVDVTAPPNVQNPTVAISWSDDDGFRWKNPIVRGLGQQGKSKTTRVSVKNTGTSGPQARRWRIDVTDPVYFGFLGATQSTDPRDF